MITLMVLVMITFVVLIVITFMVFIVVVIMVFFVMHLSDKTVALYLIETQPDIQRGEAHIIGTKESKRRLGRVDRRHKRLLANNRDLLYGMIQYNTTYALT